MSLIQNIALLLTISCLTSALAAPPRHELPPLRSRLASGSKIGMLDCWNALTEIRSCTNEIVLFFLNGDSYLSLPCCRAIRVITRDCWPSMIASIGFTSEEADILRGYCDAETSASPPPALPPTAPDCYAIAMEEAVAP